MSRERFAMNLTAAIDWSVYTPRQLAKQVGMRPETLWRWMNEGVERVNGQSQERLNALCQILGVDTTSLWSSQAAECGEKIREVVAIWEEVGLPFNWIDQLHLACTTVSRFRNEEPLLWRRLGELRGLDTDAKITLMLEGEVRQKLGQRRMSQEEILADLFELASKRRS